MRRLRVAGLILPLVLLVGGCAAGSSSGPDSTADPAATPVGPDAAPVQQLRVEVLERYPHDAAAFTQGLELHDGTLYEGTGQYGESELRIVDLDSGEVRQRVSLPDTDFGEGITVLGARVWQITWRVRCATTARVGASATPRGPAGC